MSTVVIINPQAGGGAAHSKWRKVAAQLRNAIGPFEEKPTQSRKDAIGITRKAIENGASRIIVFGGDGTISEVANGILGSEDPTCLLGVLPFGTGNDFCRSLGIGTKLAKALDVISRGRVRTVDAGEVKFVGTDGQVQKRRFINVASCGLSPVVNRLVDSHGPWLGKRWNGRLCYLLATLIAKSSYKPADVRITTDTGTGQTVRSLAVILANGRYFGGGIQIARPANLDDGKLYSVIVRPIGFAKLIANIHRFYGFGGGPFAMNEIDGVHFEQIRLESTDDSLVQIELDGEVVGRLPATIRVLPKCLNVIA